MNQKEVLEQAIKKRRSAVLVVNTQSRKGAKMFSRAVDELTSRGIHLVATHQVREAEHLSEIVREAMRRSAGSGADSGTNLVADLVIVGGGDGTLSAIVD